MPSRHRRHMASEAVTDAIERLRLSRTEIVALAKELKGDSGAVL